MGWGVARRAVRGGLAVATLLVPAGISSASSDVPGVRVVAGGVGADGAAPGLPEGWAFEHPRPGIYRLVGSSGKLVRLDVVRWDAVADVIILPVGSNATEVRFTAEGRPVDTPFSFDAAIRP
jgi:hypothetical protein